MKLEFHPEAEEEFLKAVSYYEERVAGLGERLDAEIRAATALLLEYPEIGRPIGADLRKLVLDRLPYDLIYYLSRETVYIVAVAHERRKPGYWKARLNR